MNTSPVKWIPRSDLPADLAPSNVEDYLQKQYPGERVLAEGFFAVFSELLPELLLRVFCEADLLSLLVQTNHAMVAIYSRDFLRVVGDRAVTEREIIAELGEGTALSFCGPDNANSAFYTYCTRSLWDGTGGEYDASSSSEGEPEMLYSITGVEYCWEEAEGMVVSNYDDDDQISQDRIPTTLDLFSEHLVLRKRLSCLRIDSSYGHRQLVERYNSEMSPDLPETLEAEDVSKVYMLCRTACLHEDVDCRTGRTSLLEKVFDLSQQEEIRALLLPVFIRCRKLIKAEVIRLTDAREDSGMRLCL